jgi:hypothetical protein
MLGSLTGEMTLLAAGPCPSRGTISYFPLGNRAVSAGRNLDALEREGLQDSLCRRETHLLALNTT